MPPALVRDRSRWLGYIGSLRDPRHLRPAVGLIWAFIALDMAAPPHLLGIDLPHVILLAGLGWIGLRNGRAATVESQAVA